MTSRSDLFLVGLRTVQVTFVATTVVAAALGFAVVETVYRALTRRPAAPETLGEPLTGKKESW